MAESALAKKLQIKAGARVLVLDAPEGYLDELVPLPDGAEIAQRAHGHFDVVQAFLHRLADLDRRVAVVVKSLKPGGVL